MNLFLFNQVELFLFSHGQEQVKSGESNSVTHDSSLLISLNNGKCFEIHKRKLRCWMDYKKMVDYKKARLWVKVIGIEEVLEDFLNYLILFILYF